ncbi:MAG TPA: transposase [Clostridiales bacterium]|nr:transposase [Clostridiales bacterium]
MKYIYETHFHTDEASGCGKVPALEGAKMYKDAGYAGIIVTDHFNKDTMNNNGFTDWNDFIDYNMRGYKLAKTLEDENFTVMYGIEINLNCDCDSDHLLYGVSEEYLKDHPFIWNVDSFKKFKTMAEQDGLMIFQAHPMRNFITATPPNLLDGIEVYNGNPRHDSRCDIALNWAVQNNSRMLSGSDFHQLEDFAKGGIITNHKLNSIEDFISTVMAKDYSIIFDCCKQ